MEGDLHRVIYRFFILAFDSSPIKGEGDSVGCFSLLGGLCVVRIRIYRIMGDLQDCDDAMHRFHPHL